MLSDEGYTCVMEINVVDDTSKDDANSASMLGTAEGRVACPTVRHIRLQPKDRTHITMDKSKIHLAVVHLQCHHLTHLRV